MKRLFSLILILSATVAYGQISQPVDITFGDTFEDHVNGNVVISQVFSPRTPAIAVELTSNREQWQVVKRKTDGTRLAIVTPTAVAVQDDAIQLTFPEVTNEQVGEYIVLLNAFNYPSHSTKVTKASVTSGFEAASGKSDATIYISGALVAGSRARPLYAIDAKIGYLAEAGSLGWLGARSTLVANEGTDVDPDSIRFGGVFERTWSFTNSTGQRRLGARSGVILTSNFISWEMDRRNTLRNMVSDGQLRFLVPRWLGPTDQKSLDLVFGFEAGRNRKTPTLSAGTSVWPKTISRVLLGADARWDVFKSGEFERLVISGEYRVRLPTTAEQFKDKSEAGESVVLFTTKARHYAGVDLNFKITKAVAFTTKYRYGSLPPLFAFVRHQTSVGIALGWKQKGL